MSLDSTLLMREVDRVVEEGTAHANIRYDINILAGGKWSTPQRLDYITFVRDYAGGPIGDIITVEFLMNYGDFVYDILNNRDDIKVDLTMVHLKELSSAQDTLKQTVTTRYRGILSVSGSDNPDISGKHSLLKSRVAMNQVGLIAVQMQLIDELSYKLMMVSVGVTYRRCTTMDAVKALYTFYGGLIGGNDQERMLGIDIVPGFNTEIRHQLTIPDGTMLKDVGAYIQGKEGGIYATGFGRYIQNQIVYIFPLFDTSRYSKNSKVLNIINLPNDRFQGAEKTFLDAERHLTILATGDATMLDVAAGDNIQNGNGLRFGDARKLFQDFSIEKDNKMLVDRATNLFEVAISGLKTGFNNIRWAADRLTSNPFKHYTELSFKQGQKVELEWTNGDIDLLYPAMPVKYQTISNNLVKTYYGVLLGAEENRGLPDAGPIAQRHVGKVRLSLFIDRYVIEDSDSV